MMGETLLMQRRYAEAVRAYEGVFGSGASPYWLAAARMQIGQCLELEGDGRSAAQAYEKLLADDPEGPFAAKAQARLSALKRSVDPSTPAPQARTARDGADKSKR
jgi:TolA-binding protein